VSLAVVAVGAGVGGAVLRALSADAQARPAGLVGGARLAELGEARIRSALDPRVFFGLGEALHDDVLEAGGHRVEVLGLHAVGRRIARRLRAVAPARDDADDGAALGRERRPAAVSLADRFANLKLVIGHLNAGARIVGRADVLD